MRGGRALFLDRDGTINRDTGYLHRIEECVFVDGIFDLAQSFAAAGFRLIVVTNQSGIGRGYFPEAAFHALMRWIGDAFARSGAPLDAVYLAPDAPEAATARRKPGPGMFLEAIRDFDLDPARCWSIGDADRDIVASHAAGIGTTIRLDPQAIGVIAGTRPDDPSWTVPTLSAARDLLIAKERPETPRA